MQTIKNGKKNFQLIFDSETQAEDWITHNYIKIKEMRIDTYIDSIKISGRWL